MTCFTLDAVAENQYLYMLWMIVVFICEGAHFVIFPALSSDLYGSSLGAKVYSVLFFGNATGACLGIIASKNLLPLISYDGVFYIYGGFTLISGAMLFFFNAEGGQRKKSISHHHS